MNKFTTAMFALAATAVLIRPASAQSADRITLHGFGQMNYGRSNENPFPIIGANEDGSYGNFRFLFDITAVAGDRLTIKAVPEWQQETEGGNLQEEVEIDVAWAQYRLGAGVQMRLGRSRVPYGEYGEILENGTLRPFFSLPAAIYGASGIVAEDYQGVGLQGSHFGANGWGVQWDVFGGNMKVPGERAPEESLDEGSIPDPLSEEDAEAAEIETLDNVIGAHVTFLLPGDRISFGLGAFTGDVSEEGKRHTSLIGTLVYNSAQLHVQGEVGYHEESTEKSVFAWYLEGAYKTTSGVQMGLRYDALDYDFMEAVAVLPGTESAQEHKDVSFLVGYWFTPAFVIKAELHLIDGNFFAFDEGFSERLAAGGVLDDKTTGFVIGSQFSF